MAQFTSLDQIPDLNSIPDAPRKKKPGEMLSLDDIPSLDSIPDAKPSYPNRSILQAMADPDAPPDEVGSKARSALFGPIPLLQRAGQSIADWMRGYKTPTPEAAEPPNIHEILKGFVTGPIQGYKEFAAAAPGAVSALAEHPAEAVRGLGAGLVESLSGSSAADIAGAAAGLRTKGAGALRTVAGDVLKGNIRPTGVFGATTPENAFRKASKSATRNVKESLPETMSGTMRSQQTMIGKDGKRVKLPFDQKVDMGDMNPEWLRTELEAARGELDRTLINEEERSIGLPSPEEGPMPKLLSRGAAEGEVKATSKSPAIPDPGSMMGFAQDAGRASTGAFKRQARSKAAKDVEGQMLQSVRKMQAERKAALDEAASASIMRAAGPSKMAPASITERSQALADKVEASLKEDGKPFAPPMEIPVADQQAALIQTLRKQADDAARLAKDIREQVTANPAHPDAAGAARNAERLEQQAADARRRATTLESMEPTAPAPSKTETPTVETPVLTFKPAAATKPSAGERKVSKSQATANQKFDSSLKIAKEQIANTDSVEKAAQIRDAHLKSARLQKNEVKKRAYEELARMASDKLNALVKGHTKNIAPELAEQSPVVQDVRVQRFDIQGRPLPDTEVPKPKAALETRSTGRQVEVRPGETLKEAQARENPKAPPVSKAAPPKLPKVAAEEPSIRTDLTERAPSVDESPLPPGNQVGRAPTAADLEIIKLAEQTGSGPAPAGVDPVMHANMHVLGMEAGANYKARGILDPRAVTALRQYHGASRAAEILGVTRKQVQEIADGPKQRRPMSAVLKEIDDRFNWLMEDEAGFMRNEAAIAAAGGVAGGAIGAMYGGEDIKDAVAWAIAGSLMGAAGGYRMAAGPKAFNKLAAKAEPIIELDTANLLAGPAIIKTSLGSLAGTAAGLWEAAQTGNKKGYRAGMRYLQREAAADFYRMMKMPADQLPRVGMYTEQMAAKAGIKPGMLGKFSKRVSAAVLRPFIAGDYVGTKALMKAGYSRAEAGRMMLVGEPTTWTGQTAMKMAESSMFFRLLAKFPRVRIGSLERGIEFTPGLNRMVSMRPGKGKGAYQVPKPQETLTKAQLRARAQFGGAMMAVGTAYGYFMDPNLAQAGLFSSIGGPAFAPMAAGVAAGKTLREKDVPTALSAALRNVFSNIPQIGEEDIAPERLKQRFTPGRPLIRGLQNLGIIDEE